MCAINVRTIGQCRVQEIHLKFSTYGVKKAEVNFQLTLSPKTYMFVRKWNFYGKVYEISRLKNQI